MCYTFGCMYLDKYPFVKIQEYHRYEFNSKGPKGTNRKIVEYDSIYLQPFPIFNLCFGDLNALTDELDDIIVTNNNDRKKILSTVAATVLELIRERPDAIIRAKGSTPAGTRLYQMGIGLIWDEIKEEMDLFGQIKGRWHKFTKGINYDALTLAPKSLNFNPNNKIL